MSAPDPTLKMRIKPHGEQSKNLPDQRLWIYGIHAVRAALRNPKRHKYRLVLTANAARRLAEDIEQAGIKAELADLRKFPATLASDTVHQGAALQTEPLEQPNLDFMCKNVSTTSRIVVLDRVGDPRNVGAILRSALAFEAEAVIGLTRHSPPETGALAKSASGAMEMMPYIRINNLARAIDGLRSENFILIGLDASSPEDLASLPAIIHAGRVAIVLGSEHIGLRELTRKKCDFLMRICAGSLNVSNAAAVALFALRGIE